MSSAWVVVSKDETKENLVSLYCQRDSILADDDLENEIPAGLSIWTIEIVEDITEMQENNTIYLTAKVYKDSVEQQGIGITWESSNDSIATVDNGVINAIAVGEVDIIVKITDKPTIMDTQAITVTEEVQEVITYELSGASSVNWGSTEEYNAIKKSNGSPISANFTFEVVSDGGKSTYYTLNVVDNDTCNIQHNSVGNANIIPRATDNETMEYIEKSILIKNIF